MTKLLLTTLALALAGCVSGSRTALDESNHYVDAGGKRIRGPRVNVGNFLGVTLLTIDTGIRSNFEEPVITAGASAFSKTGLEGLTAATLSERGGRKTVGYTVTNLTSDVSTNAAGVIEAGGGAAGRVINRAVVP